VTLKIRTGVCPARRNGVTIARIAESAGVAALAVHGRTRADRFAGHAEYATIAEIRQSVSIPVIANGDIATVLEARAVLAATGGDALMIGRAAQGRPWIFREIAAGLAGAPVPPEPDAAELAGIFQEHLDGLYSLYGEFQGVRVARKHIGWYLAGRPEGERFRAAINRVATAREQLNLIADFMAASAERCASGVRKAA
jgi:tRNA-dihydrouridine synthase B